MDNVVEPPQIQNPQHVHLAKLRNAVRSRIYAMLQQRLLQKLPSIDAALRDKCIKFTTLVEEKLFLLAKSEEEYSDLRSLQDRVAALFKDLQRVSNERRLAKIRSVTPTPGMDPISEAFSKMHLQCWSDF